MKSEIRSSNVPDVSGLVKREIAYNKKVPPIDEMRYRINKYQLSNASFKLRVVDRSSSIKIRFTSNKSRDSLKLQKELTDIDVHNRAFGDYSYDLEVLAVSLKSEMQQDNEYLKVIYWGQVNDTEEAEEFVENNARIVDRVIGIDGGRNGDQFICTDVNAYTKRTPNPWCRESLVTLYESKEMFKKLRDHPELGVSKNSFSKIYTDNILEPNLLY